MINAQIGYYLVYDEKHNYKIVKMLKITPTCFQVLNLFFLLLISNFDPFSLSTFTRLYVKSFYMILPQKQIDMWDIPLRTLLSFLSSL